MHAWYSPQMAKHCGTAIYAREDGSEVHVTVVNQTPNHGCKWDDLEYIGEVSHWVRRGLKGEWDFQKIPNSYERIF